MKKVYKILIILILFFASIYIFTIFFLINFPYQQLLQYLNRKYFGNYGMKASAEKIVYRIFNRLIIENLEILSGKGTSILRVKKIEVRYKLFDLKKYSGDGDIVLRGSDVFYSGPYLKARGSDFGILLDFKTKGPVNIPTRVNGIGKIVLSGEGMLIDELSVSALEMEKLKISSVNVNVVTELDEFFIKEGKIQGDGLKIEMGGKFNRSSMDLGLRFRVDDKLYRVNKGFQVLKNFVKNVNDFTIFLRGSPAKPLVSMS